MLASHGMPHRERGLNLVIAFQTLFACPSASEAVRAEVSSRPALSASGPSLLAGRKCAVGAVLSFY